MPSQGTLVKELRTIEEDPARVTGSASLVEQRATAPAVSPNAGASLFERLASDPHIDVEKLERLMSLWERNEGRVAEAAFNAAMSRAQAEMRPVAADADNPQTRSRYASYSKFDQALRPIFTTHGFGLSFDTGESPAVDYVRVLCHVTHAAGFARTYHIDMPADGKGARGGDVMTKTHATGSAVSYGMRYLLKMIFNVAVGEYDDDGNRAGAGNGGTQRPASNGPAPAGFDAWWSDMTAAADNGWAVLDKAWGASKGPFKQYVHEHKAAEWKELRAKAQKVGA